MRNAGLNWTRTGLGVVVMVALAACTANSAASNARPASGQLGSSTSAAAAGPTATTAASPSAAAPSASATGPGSVRNLLVSSADRSDLTAAFVAYKGISRSDVSGASPVPGSVYYAYDPTTNTYWALARFAASGAASLQVQVSMQDGGDIGMFQKAGMGSWQVRNGGVPPLCGYLQFFPKTVLMAWSMPTSPTTGMTC